MLIAPFGKVSFKAYILAEILTDCIIPLEDIGKVVTHVITGDWNANFTSMAQSNYNDNIRFETPDGLKWYLYVVSFLPYWWRMNQNFKKWIVYGHKLQAWNALKYAILMMSPISYIIYNETGIKAFRYGYFIFKSIGYTYKLFWDLYFDWGLLRGTRKDNRLLRDNMKFSPQFYYICMLIDVIGLYFWVIVIYLY